ncbi:hypothetical protein AB1Y20_011321 [Prymnesium parvum]|uniref:Uncharacterized protein n=1 Tax=Prymnesium parvum TaxID=97485 RepID=A0AB34ILJ2_PRYPA
MLLLIAAPRSPRCRMAAAASWPPPVVQRAVIELDTVPVFAIRLVEEDTLYGASAGALFYSQLPDAHRVLAQLSATYPQTRLELLPLGLGAAMRQAGLLGGGATASPAVIVPSPREVKTAAELAPLRARRGARGLETPLFHIGSLEWPREGDAAAERLWPFLFRAADVRAMWEQLGLPAEMPPLQVTDLEDVVDRLCAHAAGAPGSRPMLCAPLDSIEFLRTIDSTAQAASSAAMFPKGRAEYADQMDDNLRL